MDPRQHRDMPGATLVEPGTGWLQKKLAIRRFILRFALWIATGLWFLLAVVALLVHFDILPEPLKVVSGKELPAIAIVIGLIFILSEQVKEYKDEAHQFAKTLQNRVTLLDDDVKNLVTTLAPQLALMQCVERLQQALHKVRHDELLSINHLGLDMEAAWLHVQDKLLKDEGKARPIKVNYRLLMVTSDYAWLDAVSPDLRGKMKQLCDRSRDKLEEIKSHFASAASALDHVDIEIKTYASLPVLHGFYADRPTPVHYVAFCGWRGSEHSTYHWGEGHYYEIHGIPQADTSASDVLNLFDGYFEHLWSIGKLVYRNHADTSVPPHVAGAQIQAAATNPPASAPPIASGAEASSKSEADHRD